VGGLFHFGQAIRHANYELEAALFLPLHVSRSKVRQEDANAYVELFTESLALCLENVIKHTLLLSHLPWALIWRSIVTYTRSVGRTWSSLRKLQARTKLIWKMPIRSRP